MNGATPGTSTAHQPNPCSSQCCRKRASCAADSWRLIGAGQVLHHPGSAFSAASGARSLAAEPPEEQPLRPPLGNRASCEAGRMLPRSFRSAALQRHARGAERPLVPEVPDERDAGGHLARGRHRRVLLARAGGASRCACGRSSTKPAGQHQARLPGGVGGRGSSRSALAGAPPERGRQPVHLRQLLGPDLRHVRGAAGPPGRSPPRR